MISQQLRLQEVDKILTTDTGIDLVTNREIFVHREVFKAEDCDVVPSEAPVSTALVGKGRAPGDPHATSYNLRRRLWCPLVLVGSNFLGNSWGEVWVEPRSYPLPASTPTVITRSTTIVT
jgi:hypothetical protein